MKYHLIIFAIAILCISCSDEKTQKDTFKKATVEENSSKEGLGQINSQKFEYTSYIQNLDVTDLGSIDKALLRLKEENIEEPENIKDTLYTVFINFYADVLEYHDGRYKEFLIQESTHSLDSLENAIISTGLIIDGCEGFKYINEDPNFLYKNAVGFVSSSIEEYLSLRKNELTAGIFGCEGWPEIDFLEAGTRTLEIEKYLLKYPYSSYYSSVKKMYNDYIFFLTNDFMTFQLDMHWNKNDTLYLDEEILQTLVTLKDSIQIDSTKSQIDLLVTKLDKNNYVLSGDLYRNVYSKK